MAFLVGLCDDALLDPRANRRVFDTGAFAAAVVAPDIRSPIAALRSRALWLAAALAEVLPPDLAMASAVCAAETLAAPLPRPLHYL